MLPYNICENKWLSKTKQKVKNHYNRNSTLYVGYFYIIILALVGLAIITSFSSFY